VGKRGFKVVSSEWADASPEQTWDFIIPVDLAKYFTGMKPFIPPIKDTQDQTGAWDAGGQTRRINLTDGNTIGEEIVAADRPGRFTYRVGPFSGPTGMVVDHVNGEFVFEEMTGGTFVRWTYEWVPKPAGKPVVWLISKLWAHYANRVLTQLVKGAGEA
jgi:hypothetical protein